MGSRALVLALALLIFPFPSASPAQEKAEETAPAASSGIYIPFDKLPQDVATRLVEGLAKLVTLEPGDAPATLTVWNVPVLTLRTRLAGATPQERVRNAGKKFAEAIGGRMQEVPEASSFPFEGGVVFLVGRTVITGITEKDLDPMGTGTLEEVSREILENLNRVLDAVREERSLRRFLRSLGVTALATIALGAALWLLTLLMRHLRRWVARGEEAVRTAVGAGAVPALESVRITRMTRWIFALAIWAARIFLVFTWLAFSLGQFPYTRPWGDQLGSFVIATIKNLVLGIAVALPDLFTVVVIFVIARLLARLVRQFFESIEQGKVETPWVFPETAMPTRKILVFLIWVFALVAAYPYIPGSGSEAFKGLSVLIGLMISLGGSGVISQAMGGVVLMYSRALRTGDYVRVGEIEGVVISLGMMATKIRTNKRVEVTLPNSVVLSTSTKNYSRLGGDEGVILHTAVSIGYSAPWRKVQELLVEAARRTEGLRKEPEPFVNQKALDDFYVQYELNAHLERPETRIRVLSALHANIQDAFNEAGVAIVSPHYETDPAHPMPEGGGPAL